MAEFDDVAALYDQTRGGEERGDDYAGEIDGMLPADAGSILEVGVGTGVVALGLRRRGHQVIGIDVSRPMLARAYERLGPVLVQTDAEELAISASSVSLVVSVWVVHAIADPARHFTEVARVLVEEGLYVACSGQEPADDDEVGQIIQRMSEQVDIKRGAPRPRRVAPEQVLEWAAPAGLTGNVRQRSREWQSSPSDELFAIENRIWPAMRELSETDLEEVTRPAIDALRALPQSNAVRRATTAIVILTKGQGPSS